MQVLCGHQARGRNRKEGGTIINPRDKAVKKCWRDYDLILLIMAPTSQTSSESGFSDVQSDGADGAPPPQPPSSQSDPVKPPPAPPSVTPPPGPPSAPSPSETVPPPRPSPQPNHHFQAENFKAVACSLSDDDSVPSGSGQDFPIKPGNKHRGQ